MTKSQYYILPNTSRGGWSIEKSNNPNDAVHTTTKSEAIKLGTIMAHRSGSDLIINQETSDNKQTK